jgi:hypothetical protein
VVLVMVVGCIMVFFGLMHFGALFPCVVHFSFQSSDSVAYIISSSFNRCVIAEIQSDDPSNMTKEEYQQQLQQFTI